MSSLLRVLFLWNKTQIGWPLEVIVEAKFALKLPPRCIIEEWWATGLSNALRCPSHFTGFTPGAFSVVHSDGERTDQRTAFVALSPGAHRP